MQWYIPSGTKLQQYTCVYSSIPVTHLFLSFLCFLGVDVSVDLSSGGVRGVDDGVRNLVCLDCITWHCSGIKFYHLHWSNRTRLTVYIIMVVVCMYVCDEGVDEVTWGVEWIPDTWYVTNLWWVMCVMGCPIWPNSLEGYSPATGPSETYVLVRYRWMC